MYDRILVPVGGTERTSETSSAALRYAAAMADDHGAAVYLFETSEGGIHRVTDRAVDRLSQPDRSESSSAWSMIDTESEAVESIRGDRHQNAAFPDCVEVFEIDLLVFEVETDRPLVASLFGSPIDRYLAADRLPAVTVRSDETVSQSYPYDAVLVPLTGRGSRNWRTTVEHGTEIAKEHDATVHLLSVVDEAILGDSVWSTDIVDRLTENARERGERAATIAADAVADVTTAVSHKPLETAVSSYAAETGIDLTVLESNGSDAIGRQFGTSATERVLRHTPTPVFHATDSD